MHVYVYRGGSALHPGPTASATLGCAPLGYGRLCSPVGRTEAPGFLVNMAAAAPLWSRTRAYTVRTSPPPPPPAPALISRKSLSSYTGVSRLVLFQRTRTRIVKG